MTATIPDGCNICLDTNVLVHLLRQDYIGEFINNTFGLTQRTMRPFLCEVSIGELHSLAIRNNWGAERIALLVETIQELPTANIVGETIYFRYAQIDNFAHAKGVTMGKNDLWIAAVTSIQMAYLITLDRDFLPLQDYPGFNLVYVAQDKIPRP
ncbi:MAG: PIN domain-containing protein [Candidatus Obscuribacterales bacterium]|nr:PIN domain-containing protein [Candidatus Obscuribacterales bacterium]